jgi:hypothetical protein
MSRQATPKPKTCLVCFCTITKGSTSSPSARANKRVGTRWTFIPVAHDGQTETYWLAERSVQIIPATRKSAAFWMREIRYRSANGHRSCRHRRQGRAPGCPDRDKVRDARRRHLLTWVECAALVAATAAHRLANRGCVRRRLARRWRLGRRRQFQQRDL